MSDLSNIPDDDFVFDRVDFEFWLEINLLMQFIHLSSERLKSKKELHVACEVFTVLKTLMEKKLPSLYEKIAYTEKAEKDVLAIIENHRKAIKNELSVDKKLISQGNLGSSDDFIKI